MSILLLYFAVPTFQTGDTSYCFATCNSGITNAAPGGSSDGSITLGGFTCNEAEGGLYSATKVGSSAYITLPKNIETEGAKTGAILLKHSSDFVDGSSVPREFIQTDSFVLNSEPYPAARAEVKNSGGRCFGGPYNNVFSKTEFVLVVITADGTTVSMYKNGVKLGDTACTRVPQTNSNILRLGANSFGGTIKSFAIWNRALSAVEVASIDSTKLTCS